MANFCLWNLVPSIGKYKFVVLGVLLGIAAFISFRSCTLFNAQTVPQYMIGQDTRWNGLHVMGKERNISAMNNELLSVIARKGQFRVHMSVSADPIQELESGKLQGALTAMQPSYLNEKHMLFSKPYFRTGLVLILPMKESIDGWNEKRMKIIGVKERSSMLTTLAQDPTVHLKIYNDILTALVDLTDQRIDGAIFPAIPAYTYTRAFYKNDLKIVPLPLTDEESIRLVALNDAAGKELIEKFNDGLVELKETGE